MNVLSLFDGISCGRIALDRAGIRVDNYYASEIDKYATAISTFNYPRIIRLGDVNNWKSWKLPKIDLILAGSPCQGFSRAGKHLKFDDPRSKLFFVFVDILKHYKPRYFLLENVKMDKEAERIITEYMGVEPIEINSALVSVQSRVRLYWTNIPNISQPEDKGIVLLDVLQPHPPKKYYIGESASKRLDEVHNSEDLESPTVVNKNGETSRIKSFTIEALYGKGVEKSYGSRPFIYSKPVQVDSLYDTNAQAGRVYSIEGKSVTLKGLGGGLGAKTGLYSQDGKYRRLTPVECERLQTIPDGYTFLGEFENGATKEISDTQRYKALGNGWTVDVIAHILSFMEVESSLSPNSCGFNEEQLEWGDEMYHRRKEG